MTDDRSLDDFVRGDGDDADDAGDDADDTGDDTEMETPPSDAAEDDAGDAGDDPEPARAVAAFDPDGAACASCGESVSRRWDDDGALVCADCKAW